MCSRYSRNLTRVDLSFVGLPPTELAQPTTQVNPGQQVWLVRQNDQGKPELAMAKWGLVPAWLQDFSRAQINARVESAATMPMFSHAWSTRRCLILADGYFQWHVPAKSQRQLWSIKPKESPLLLMAGLWERYDVDASLSFDSCAVLTMPVVAGLSLIAQRMPAVITPQFASRWLSGAPFSAEDFQAMGSKFAFQSQNLAQGRVDRLFR